MNLKLDTRVGFACFDAFVVMPVFLQGLEVFTAEAAVLAVDFDDGGYCGSFAMLEHTSKRLNHGILRCLWRSCRVSRS